MCSNSISASDLYAAADVHGAKACDTLYTSVAATPAPVRVPTHQPLVPRFTSVIDWIEDFPPGIPIIVKAQ